MTIRRVEIMAVKRSLRKYLSEYALECLSKSKRIGIEEVEQILKIVMEYEERFGKPDVIVVMDRRGKEVESIELWFPEGNWEEWGELVKEFKGKMEVSGLGHLKGMIVIVCVRGLVE